MQNCEIIIVILKSVKVIVFLFAFIFSTYYGIPRGIVLFLEWERTREFSKLSRSTSFLLGSGFIFIYVSFRFIFELITEKF
jgi:hypothetical protein